MTESLQQLAMWVAIGLVFGAVGSALIVRQLRGIPVFAGLFVLTLVPYVAVLATIAAFVDPTLNAQQTAYNSQMAFALFVIGFTVPWIVACLIGGLTGRWLRKAPGA